MQFKIISLTDEEQDVHDHVLSAKMTGQQSDADLVKWMEKVDRLKMYEKFGETSLFNYCVNVIELSARASYAVKAVALKSREIPELHWAVESGHSLWIVAKLVPHITDENKDKWLDRLATQKKSEVEAAISKISKRKKKDHVENGETHSRIAGDLENDVLALLKRAQTLVSKSKRKQATLNETLKVAFEVFLEKADPVRKAERALVRKKVFSAEKTFGRKAFTAEQEHAVYLKTRGECQGLLPNGEKCGSMHFTEIHHIIEVALGGTNHPDNLTTLCSAHHRIHHKYRGSSGSFGISRPAAT